MPPRISLRRISIAHIDPASPGRFKHATSLIEDSAQLLNVFLDRRFQSELAFHMVIPKLPVRGRGDEAIDRLWRHRFQNSQCLALHDGIAIDLNLLFDAPLPQKNAVWTV